MKRRADGRYVKVEKYTKLDGSKAKKWFYGYSVDEITKQIREFKYELQCGRYFKVIAEEWKEEHFPTLEYNTLKPYRPALQRAIDEFGEYRISEITAPMINSFILRFAKRGYARKTVAHQLVVIHMIMGKAAVDGEILYNPADAVKVPKGLKKNHREMPEDEELEIIKRSIDKTFGLLPYFILYTGLRKGEALALTYGDIDRKRKIITVSKSVYHDNNRPKIKTPKTDAGERDVILLDRLLLKLPEGKPNELVFPDENGELLTETKYQSLWEQYQKETGVSCTAHQLRHAYASLLDEIGVADKEAQELMGHANVQTLKDIYTHVRKSRKENLAKDMNEKMG